MCGAAANRKTAVSGKPAEYGVLDLGLCFIVQRSRLFCRIALDAF